ncbi:MAG: CARDB domain-containing protein [Archaeoglobaceae archaeon]|nr:hypothetical protein [Archaeoglobaceae archaeon]MDW7989187.1 CARDB domain-containing protein [Archaeoglobaceae archaeon]
MSNKAVSPLIGFILLMAIMMGLIGIIQSTALPQWNKAVEAKHFSELKYEIADIDEVLSISASTGNPAKIVLKAGVEYPNYYILFSPSKTSSIISAKNLNVRIKGFTIVGSQILPLEFDNYTSAIVFEPNYFYSERSKLVYEHSAVLRIENNVFLAESKQSSFMKSLISLHIIKAKFNIFATTENANLIFIPISVGGKNIFSGKITFECFDENTAEFWNKTLSGIYGNVVRDKKNITLDVDNITLEITVFEAYILSPGEISESQTVRNLKIINITEKSYYVFRNSTLQLGVKVLDDSNRSIEGITVLVYDNILDKTYTLFSDDFGEIWYTFHASRTGNWKVNFTLSNNIECSGFCWQLFNITVTEKPTDGSDICPFSLQWFNASTEEPIENDFWSCNFFPCSKNFTLNVRYHSSNVQDILVNFARNSSIISVSEKTKYTNIYGNATASVTAIGNGTAALIGIVANCVKILQININQAIIKLPDLTVKKITIDPASPVVGNQVNINAKIENIGNANAGAFTVSFYANNSRIGEVRIDRLDAESNTVASIKWTPKEAGEYIITVVADSGAEIYESNEANNETSVMVRVNPVTTKLTLQVCGRQSTWYVNVDPPDHNCPAGGRFMINTCTYTYPLGTDVKLTAHPPGNFISWSGDCSGSSTCKLHMDSDKYVFAEFSGCMIIPVPTIEPPYPPYPPYIY